jgi:methyltransferase
MVTAYLLFLALVAGERLIELVVSARNAAWARARGGVEEGRGHFRVMAALHAAFLVACGAEVIALERPFVPVLGLPMLALALSAQALRWWAIASLGRAWNVRVIVIPGGPLVTRGPYAWLRHPNYVAVVVEGFALPLIHSAWLTAAGFTALNAALLVVRVRCEERALARHAAGADDAAARPRFWPGRTGPPGARAEET